MTLGARFYWVIALVAFVALAGAAATATSRLVSAGDETHSAQACDVEDELDDATEATQAQEDSDDIDDIDEQCGDQNEEDDENRGPSGALDDGSHLLPQADITLSQAIEAAQGAASGSVGEVDLEHWDGKLVFNVDIGDKDVKVDAGTGTVLAVEADD
jgi:uncharacterized membrane protein YkoI